MKLCKPSTFIKGLASRFTHSASGLASRFTHEIGSSIFISVEPNPSPPFPTSAAQPHPRAVAHHSTLTPPAVVSEAAAHPYQTFACRFRQSLWLYKLVDCSDENTVHYKFYKRVVKDLHYKFRRLLQEAHNRLSENYDGRVPQALDFEVRSQILGTNNRTKLPKIIASAATLVQGSKFKRLASEHTSASDIGSSMKLEAVVEQVMELQNQQV